MFKSAARILALLNIWELLQRAARPDESSQLSAQRRRCPCSRICSCNREDLGTGRQYVKGRWMGIGQEHDHSHELGGTVSSRGQGSLTP